MTTSEPLPDGGEEQRMWPTPNARDWKDTGPNVDWEKVAAKSKLAGAVMWPTPQAQDAKHRPENAPNRRRQGRQLQLTHAVYPMPPEEPPDEDDPQLMLWPEDSPASQSPTPGKASRRRIAGGSGPQPVTSFATYDPAGCCWKTFQGCLDGEWETYSATWPPAGMTRSGIAFRRASSVPPIYATASGLWPTPRTTFGGESPENYLERIQRPRTDGSPAGSGIPLDVAARMWPTPMAGDAQQASRMPSGSPTLIGAIRQHGTGQLNPEWVEWLMGYPAGWTASED